MSARSGPPRVTVLCATCNGRDAVRLTFASFRRHTTEPCVVLVADNGSTDGTLDDLLSRPEITVFPLEGRTADMSEEQRREAATHAATLDWLAGRVETPYFLTLDSDVEFLADGWLEDMLAVMERENLVAMGEYEPAIRQYRARLAPYLLLWRTSGFRALNASFAGRTLIYDAGERRRYLERRATHRVDVSELDDYPTSEFYPVGATLLLHLQATGAAWLDTPPDLRARYRHIGHMSWGGNREEIPGEDEFHAEYLANLDYVRQRLRRFERASTTPAAGAQRGDQTPARHRT